MNITFSPLKPGDKVAIVSLSRGILGEPFVKHEKVLLEKRLEEFGLQYEYMPNALSGMDYLRDHPEARAADLIQAFWDDSIKMIWTVIGGDDTFRTLPFLLGSEEFRKLVREKPKIFMGFSDTTTNHLMFHQLGLPTFYGPSLLADLAEFSPELPEYTKDWIEKLFAPAPEGIDITSSPVWYKARTDFSPEQVGVPAEEVKEARGFEFLGAKRTVQGELLGGCLEILSDPLLCLHYPEEQKRIFAEFPIFPPREDWRGKVLFMETSEEQPSPEKYRQMVKALEDAGVFSEVSGVLAGKPVDENHYDEYKTVLEEIGAKYNLPVVYNMNFGHSTPRMILPIGGKVEISPEKHSVRLMEGLVGSEVVRPVDL